MNEDLKYEIDAAVKALKFAGLRQESAELVRQTLAAFRGNFAEFLHPFTGSGEGVKDYAWTAGLFIREVIEEIFGITWRPEHGLDVHPNLPEPLRECRLALEDLILPDGTRTTIEVEGGRVKQITVLPKRP